MLTVKLTPEQLDEIEHELKTNLLVRPYGAVWQVRVAALGGEVLGKFEDELNAYIRRDDIVRAAMSVIRNANAPRGFWGGDPA